MAPALKNVIFGVWPTMGQAWLVQAQAWPWPKKWPKPIPNSDTLFATLIVQMLDAQP